MRTAAFQNTETIHTSAKTKDKTDAPADPTQGEKPKQTKKGLFEKRDVDNNDEVTLKEYLTSRTGEAAENLTERFNERDTDGDGVWERSEMMEGEAE